MDRRLSHLIAQRGLQRKAVSLSAPEHVGAHGGGDVVDIDDCAGARFQVQWIYQERRVGAVGHLLLRSKAVSIK